MRELLTHDLLPGLDPADILLLNIYSCPPMQVVPGLDPADILLLYVYSYHGKALAKHKFMQPDGLAPHSSVAFHPCRIPFLPRSYA